MNSVSSRDERGADDVGNIEVAFAACSWPDTDMFVGQAHRKRIAISFGVGDDAGDAHLTAGADDSQGDFTTISYQYFTKHRYTCTGTFAAQGTHPSIHAVRPLYHAGLAGCQIRDSWIRLST